MAIIIGSARWGESGGYNQNAGDASGKEVATENYYTHEYGWYVLRAKSAKHANAIAERMLAACANDNIGYDMGGRYGVIKYGIDTKVKTEADCSSLVRQCVKEATGKDAGDFTTANEKSKLMATGLFEDAGSCDSKAKSESLCIGDILVSKKQGHTAIVVKGANKRVEPTPKKKERVQIMQASFNATDAQQWKLVKDGSYYKIQNKSGKVLDVKGGEEEAMKNGRVVQAWRDNGTDAQRWKLVENPNITGTYFICSKLDENYVLDVVNGTVAKRAYLQLHKKQSEKSKQWAESFYIVDTFAGYKAILNAKSLYVVDANPTNIVL